MIKRLRAGMLLFLLSLIFTIPAYAADTDSWLDGWEYEIQGDGTTVYLTAYNGDQADIDIYGKAKINGSTYNTVIYYNNSSSKSALTGNTAIRSISFHAVSGQKVKGSYEYSLNDFFANMTSLETITFGDGFDSSGIQNMKEVFLGDTSLRSVDIASLDLSSAKVFSSLFSGCSAITDIDLYLPKAYAYNYMFRNCTSLENVRVTGDYDGGKFTSIQSLFENCSSLKNVELVNIKTGGISEFKSVFKGCSSLESIDLSMIDLSSATDLTYMFQGCTSLKSIDLAPINFAKVTDMSYMFVGCSSLTSLDLSGHSWPSSGTKMNQVISSCPNLTEIIVDENVIVSSSTSGIGGEASPVKTTVIGRTSDSFDRYFIGKFQTSRRYLTAVTVRAGINLVGDSTYDSWFYGLKLSNNSTTFVTQNRGEDSISFDGTDKKLFIYAPGEVTITLTQGEYAWVNGGETVNAVTETEDGFSCPNNPLTKTINVIRNTDGSIDIEEI